MEQNITMLFVPIGLLMGGISVLEKGYMFGIDDHIDKLNKKYGMNIDVAAYCRFEGIEKIKGATHLLIFQAVYLLFDVDNPKLFILMLCIFGIIDVALYSKRRKKFLSSVKSQY